MDSNCNCKRQLRSFFGQSLFIGLNLFILVVNSHANDHSKNVKENNVNIAYYDEIKDLPNHPNVLLIDVREPHELEQTGRIPTSINIPLSNIQKTLSNETSPKIFEELYGREKPKFDSPIIFSCRSGRRSLLAYREAEILGYKNIKNYQGSWLEWAERENL